MLIFLQSTILLQIVFSEEDITSDDFKSSSLNRSA